MSWAYLNDIVGAIYDIVGNTNYHILGTYLGYISWVSKFMSWVHMLDTDTYIVDAYRGYISWVHVLRTYRGYSFVHVVGTCRGHMSWVLVTTSWVHIVDTPLGYLAMIISWVHKLVVDVYFVQHHE